MENNNALHEDLHRGLEERHIQLIALGGAVWCRVVPWIWRSDQKCGSINITYVFLGRYRYVLYYEGAGRSSS